nr:HAD domain-containing protein [Vibrio coralliirubri]
MNSTSKPKKVVIFVDYNGVLDSYENTIAIEEANPELKRGEFDFLKATVLHDRVYKIAKLALEHNALVVTTSDFRREGVNFYSLIRATVAKRGTEEQKAFVVDNKRTLRGLCTDVTGVGRSRNIEITDYIEKEGVTHCVVLEDDHDIDSLYNRIWVSGYRGLSDANFNELESYLKSF